MKSSLPDQFCSSLTVAVVNVRGVYMNPRVRGTLQPVYYLYIASHVSAQEVSPPHPLVTVCCHLLHCALNNTLFKVHECGAIILRNAALLYEG